MKYDKYLSLIRELESAAASGKGWYEFRVLLLTAVGYGYFVGLILLLIAPFVLIILGILLSPAILGKVFLESLKFWWLLGPALGIYFGLLGSAAGAITAKVPDPSGNELISKDAPELFAFVKTACRELKAKRPKKILVDDSFNAAVVTLPKFGIFGRKVVMTVGLPLMRSLSQRQFEAVLAHEIGHISGKHGGFAKWAYQMREAWGRLIEAEESTGHRLRFLYQTFVDRFFPYFTAYSFVLMREHEKQADREAASLVGSKELGESLILLEVRSRTLTEEFWPAVHEENVATRTPPTHLFSRMLSALSSADPDRSKDFLEQAVGIPTDFNDSHPSLAERLRLIGYWSDKDIPIVPQRSDLDAASIFLGRIVDRLTDQFNDSWDEQAAETWQQTFDHFQRTQKRVQELEEKRGAADTTFEELNEIARLTMEKDGVAAAMPILEDAVDRFPAVGVAWFNRGGGRLSLGNDSGLEDLEKAQQLDTTLKVDAYQLSFDYLRSKGRFDEAAKFAALIEGRAEIHQKAELERSIVEPTDQFAPHGLSSDFVRSISKKLAGLEEISAIYAVNKVVRYMPEFPFCVLLVEFRKRQPGDASSNEIVKIVSNRLNTGEVHWIGIVNSNWRKNAKGIFDVPDAKVFSGTSGE